MNDEHEHQCLDLDKLAADIEKFGWALIFVESTEYLPSFCYTIGLWKTYKHPEIICFGFTFATLHTILNEAGAMVKSGETIAVGKSYGDFFEEGSTEFVNVDGRNIEDYFGQAIDFHQTRTFPAIQMVWTDRNNKFPWEANFEEEFRFRQPLLDRNGEFKFFEYGNLGVFTTRQFTELEKPILRVVHDHNGDWQFLTGDQMPDDIRHVCLNDIVQKDLTLNDVFDLDYGEVAVRETVGGSWKRSKLVFSE